MSDHEHTINRTDRTRSADNDDGGDEEDEQRSEAEIKRELRKSVVGRAILEQNRDLKQRGGGPR